MQEDFEQPQIPQPEQPQPGTFQSYFQNVGQPVTKTGIPWMDDEGVGSGVQAYFKDPNVSDQDKGHVYDAAHQATVKADPSGRLGASIAARLIGTKLNAPKPNFQAPPMSDPYPFTSNIEAKDIGVPVLQGTGPLAGATAGGELGEALGATLGPLGALAGHAIGSTGGGLLGQLITTEEKPSAGDVAITAGMNAIPMLRQGINTLTSSLGMGGKARAASEIAASVLPGWGMDYLHGSSPLQAIGNTVANLAGTNPTNRLIEGQFKSTPEFANQVQDSGMYGEGETPDATDLAILNPKTNGMIRDTVLNSGNTEFKDAIQKRLENLSQRLNQSQFKVSGTKEANANSGEFVNQVSDSLKNIQDVIAARAPGTVRAVDEGLGNMAIDLTKQNTDYKKAFDAKNINELVGQPIKNADPLNGLIENLTDDVQRVAKEANLPPATKLISTLQKLSTVLTPTTEKVDFNNLEGYKPANIPVLDDVVQARQALNQLKSEAFKQDNKTAYHGFKNGVEALDQIIENNGSPNFVKDYSDLRQKWGENLEQRGLVNKTSNFTPGLNDQATQKQWLSELDQHGQHPNPTLNEQLQKVPDLNDTTQLLDATDNFKDLKSSQQALNNVNQQSGQDGSIILKHQQNLAKMGIAPTEYTKFLRQGMFPEKVSDVNQPKEMIKKWDDLSEANQKLIMDGKGEALDKFLHTYYEPLANVMEADPKYNPEINEYKKGMVTANIGKRPLDYLMTGTGVPGKVKGIIDAFGGPAIADKIMSLPSKYAEMLATGKIDDNPKTGIGYALSRLVQYLQTTGNLNPPKDTDNSSGAK